MQGVNVCATHPLPTAVSWLARGLQGLDRGELRLMASNGASQVLQGAKPGPRATLTVQRPVKLALRVGTRGALGFAEGYLAGDWSSPDLPRLLQLLALNEDRLGSELQGLSMLRPMDIIRHRAHSHSRRRSRRNVAYHYDLGNAFYRLWLDETMTYSCALFEHATESLETAQARKYDTILALLDAKPGDHILEIGCGWGGFALRAAARGLTVTGLTLSAEQLAYANQRVHRAGAGDRVTLRLQDYRDASGRYDHIVSIEMFEAVGEAHWPEYFAMLSRCLRPGGRAALQVIAIDDAHYAAYRGQPDFIQRYVFPGGMLPSARLFNQHACQAGLQVVGQSFYGRHYAHTLAHWYKAFNARAEAISELGFDDRFLRLWRYYLAYCEAGFRTGRIDLMQVVLTAADSATGSPSSPRACPSRAQGLRRRPRTAGHPRR